MKNLFCLLMLALSMSVTAQVAINTDGSVPDNSAMLDVKSTDKGILLPRMTLAQRNAITSPANGLMIYQTDNSPGYYYNSGTSGSPVWVISGTGSGWGLTGNSGTASGTNFIGTTDNVPLTFRVNNLLSGKIDPSKYNVSLGYQTLNSNTTGYGNTANGDGALYSNTTGYSNTANGDGALYLNNSGKSNTANGRYTLFYNDIGSYNTANGDHALYSNTSGSNNTANGMHALYSNTTGNSNTANGLAALYSNIDGSFNAANGVSALFNNTTGNYNTANGYNALIDNTTGNYNTANGPYALGLNTEGNYNTANGSDALFHNTTGIYNTAIGSYAMQMNSDGNWNTCIGEYTNTSIHNLQGASSFGASSITNADNKIVIGANVAGMVIGGYATWSNLSDGRFKEDIKENVAGLAFISQLRPVTYWINTDKLQRHITAQMPDSIAQHYLPTAEEQAKDKEYTHTGFVAQEVEATAKAIGYAFDGVNAPKNPTDNYSIAYSQFVPSLVKAVQELAAQNEEMKKEIENLKKELNYKN
jgi:trimeric autotransporter adhesin